jgi:hypothetical protein
MQGGGEGEGEGPSLTPPKSRGGLPGAGRGLPRSAAPRPAMRRPRAVCRTPLPNLPTQPIPLRSSEAGPPRHVCGAPGARPAAVS